MRGELSRAMVMSIKPEWATLIYQGRKTVEVRKVSIHKWTLPCLLYETAPVSMVTGIVLFGDRFRFDRQDFMQMSDSCLTTEDVESYIGTREVYGYRVKEVRRLTMPIEISELGIDPPRSYRYVEVPSEVLA